MSSAEDLGVVFARNAATVAYNELPVGAADAAKKSILDLIGVSLAATGIEPVARRMTAFALEAGGKAESAVLGTTAKVSAPWAAFANGGFAHCLDFDDLTPWGAHATSSILPAALAVAQRNGGASGRDLIAAVAIGQDMFTRMIRNVAWRKDWSLSTIFGVFAATAAAGRLLGLSQERMASALGLSAMQAAGTMDIVYAAGGDQRCIYAAFSAKAAVVSALLAESGVVGSRSAFTGEYGVFNVFFRDAYDRDGMVRDLGRDFMGDTTLYKPWPAVGPSHSHISAAIDLVSENALQPDEILEIRLSIGDYHEIMCTPLEVRQAPTTLVDAKFSLPFLVALAVVQRHVALSHFVADGLQDPSVLATARKIKLVKDPAFDWTTTLPGGRVEIVTKRGDRFARTGTHVPGSQEAPMSWSAIERKFADCAVLGAMPLSASRISAIQTWVRGLEQIDDVRVIVDALTHPD